MSALYCKIEEQMGDVLRVIPKSERIQEQHFEFVKSQRQSVYYTIPTTYHE